MPLEGTWFNELGSTMTIDAVTPGQPFTGSYQTAVSTTACAQGSFQLVGTCDTDTDGTSVGFVVAWVNGNSNCHSITAWSGQLQIIGGQEEIVATWLLTMETDPGQDWASTLVGQDVFTRNPVAKETLTLKTQQKRHPHP
jgi:hypothetical protein